MHGEKLLAEAHEAGLAISEVFVTDAKLTSYYQTLFGSVVEVEEALLTRSLDVVSPQKVVAVAAMPETDLGKLASIATGKGGLLLANVSDPGNVGTLLRSAEASGASFAIAAGRCAELFNPKVVRAAAGALFRFQVFYCGSVEEAITACQSVGLKTYATVVDQNLAPTLYHQKDLTSAVFVLGNEAQGLQPEVIDYCDENITIELGGPTESLNVASAGTVLAFEALRQRQLVE